MNKHQVSEKIGAEFDEIEDELSRLKAELEKANEQVAALEGQLMQIGGLKNHAKRVALVRIQALDNMARSRLLGNEIKKPIPLSVDENIPTDQMLTLIRENDIKNYAKLSSTVEPMGYKTYLKSSRVAAQLARNVQRALKK